jgi:anti-sigma factor RsiW
MIHCTETLAEQHLGSYVEGTLADDEALQFEEHYFDCPECLAQVQALQAVALQLRNQPRPRLKAPAPWPIRLGALLALAAMVMISLFVLRARHDAARPSIAASPAQQPGTAPSNASPSGGAPSNAAAAASAPAALARLADLTLPAYQASQLRGEGRNPQFEAGMAAYTGRDCAHALKALAKVPAEDEDSRGAHFYSGVCLMQQGDMAGAAERLRSVANAGDSPQQEAAFYYLAQIALADQDAAAARRYLGHAVQLHGDFEARAQAEFSRLRVIKGN